MAAPGDNILTTYSSLLAEIRDEWDKTESYIKQAEQVSNTVVFPSIKELRYAGRRIVDALHVVLSNGSPERVADLLRDARFDCHRARHDAIDAATSTIAVELELAVRYLGVDLVATEFSQYTEMVKLLGKIREEIVESRRNRENRESIYQSIEDSQFPKLLKLYQDFKQSEAPIKKAAMARAREVRVAYVVAAISMATALGTAIIAFF